MKEEVRRVAWTEGMLMCPQHLQQQDLYHQRMLSSWFGALSPYSWGAVSVRIDPGALGSGELRLLSFTGVLPDGTPLSFRQGDREAPAARPIEGHFPAGQQEPLEIFLGLPVEREGVPSFEEAADARAQFPPRARFAMETRMVRDLASAGRPVEITFGTPNVVVLFGNEPRDDFSAIKVAEVTRDAQGALVLVDTYIPPSLRIDAAPFITTNLSQVLGVLTGKQKALSSQRRERDNSSVEFSGSDVTRYLQLNAVNGLIPLFVHMGRSPDLHPHQLYLLLIQVAGQLTTFSAGTDPAQLPAFNFTDLRSTFEELFAVIKSMLQSTVREAHVPIPLQIKHGVHFGRFDSEPSQRCRAFVVAVRAEGVPEDQVAERLAGLSKIASWNQIQSVVRAATPGVPLKLTHRPPPEVPIKSGVVYFVVDTDSSHWKHVMDEKAIAIYLPPPFDATKVKVELLGIPPRKE